LDTKPAIPKNTPSTPAQALPHGDLLILKAQLVSSVQFCMRPQNTRPMHNPHNYAQKTQAFLCRSVQVCALGVWGGRDVKIGRTKPFFVDNKGLAGWCRGVPRVSGARGWEVGRSGDWRHAGVEAGAIERCGSACFWTDETNFA
jgi:hypothetical protein